MDDDEFDYWFNASDEECARVDASINNLMTELGRKLDAMTVAQQVAHHRHFLLQDILENRERLRRPELNTIEFVSNIWREHLRYAQLRLAKLRIWRATGTYPGQA